LGFSVSGVGGKIRKAVSYSPLSQSDLLFTSKSLTGRCAVIKWSSVGFIAVLAGAAVTRETVSHAQVVERESSITGPRGRTIDRRLTVERGRGTYERQLQIQRPGATLQRDFLLQRRPLAGGGFGVRPPVILERNVFVGPRPGPFWSFGIAAAPVITLPFWQSPPPPPVVVAPPGAGTVPPPGVAGAAPPPPPPGAQPSPLDPVALAAQRLQSHHSSSRRDAAQTLGRLGDPRAIPPLVHVLKYDTSKDVKSAAATALGEIGGNDAEVVLERCIIYEKKQEVRDVAAVALRRLREKRDGEPASGPSASAPLSRNSPRSQSTQVQAEVPRLSAPAPAPSPRTSPFRPRFGRDEPTLDGPASEKPDPSGADREPPPPPTPVGPS
jgi:hypothetical protein